MHSGTSDWFGKGKWIGDGARAACIFSEGTGIPSGVPGDEI
jgi:hypothetical protein